MVVHQELMLFPDRNVEEDVFAGVLPARPFAWISRSARRQKVEAAMDRLGATVDLRARVGDLPLSQRQLVEIARALCAGGTVLVLDEPTSALSEPEARGLFDAIRAIVARSAAVIFVSHRLDEVFSITDAVTVLRDGRVAGRWRTAEADMPTITRAMVGDLANERARPRVDTKHGAVAISVQGSTAGLTELSLSLRGGEIVGLAGLEGSGVATVIQMLGGVVPVAGRLEVKGRATIFKNPSQAIAKGVVYMPPDRKKDGLWLRARRWLQYWCGAGGADAALKMAAPRSAGARRLSADVCRSASAPTRCAEAVGRLLGRQSTARAPQQVTESRPQVLLLNDFTRGVDVRAKAAIHQLVRGLAGTGLAICISSSDLEELLGVADRIVCMRGGRIVADRRSDAFDKRTLLALVSSASDELAA